MSLPVQGLFRSRYGLAALAGSLLIVSFALSRPLEYTATGAAVLLRSSLNVAAVGLLAWVAAGLGSRLINQLYTRAESSLLHWALSLGLGLGAMAYGLVGLGFVGALTPIAIASLLGLCALAAGEESNRLAGWLVQLPAKASMQWNDSSQLARLAVVLMLAMLLLSFVLALTPPYDYDGLMYHLPGPQRFLETGGFFPVPDTWQLNGPLAVESLFTIGLARGNDVLPKLMHWLFGLIVLVGTCWLGRRMIPRQGGWLSLGILLGMPVVMIISSYAYIDMAWAAFELLALLCFLEWRPGGRSRWLVLAGTFYGFALGAKWTAAAGLAVVCVLLLWRIRSAPRTWPAALARLLAPALLLASPWLIRNWIWLDNPIYPLGFGGPGWSAARLAMLQGYLSSFGTGRSPGDLLLFPLNVYLHFERYGTVLRQIEYPNPLFLLVFSYPWVKKHPQISLLLALSAGCVAIWYWGSQQLRFLLPVAPVLAVSTAYMIDQMQSSPGWAAQRLGSLLKTLVVLLLGLALGFQVAHAAQLRPFSVVVGMETRERFIGRAVKDFATVSDLRASLRAGERILLVGNGRSYYCLTDCLPDPEHFRWAAEIAARGPGPELSTWLGELNVSYILLVEEDIDFLLEHDPGRVMERAGQVLASWHAMGCLRAVPAPVGVLAYRVVCRPASGAEAREPALRCAALADSNPLSSPRTAQARRARW